MYGCFDAYIIYGFTEGNRDRCISEETLDKFGVNMYAVETEKGYMGEAAYGIRCEFDSRHGQAYQPSIDEMNKVIRLFEAYLKHYNHSYYTLGYHLVVSGDYETCHTCYDLE